MIDVIHETIDLWVSGYTNIECIYDMKDIVLPKTTDEMISIKSDFYNMITNELKKLLKIDNIETIEEKLNGKINVFWDETKLFACIINDDMYHISSDEEYEDDYDY